jgi:hypothetical protein
MFSVLKTTFSIENFKRRLMKDAMSITLKLLLYAILVTGCASTKLTSFKEPSFNNSFQKIIIYANVSDLEERGTIENVIVSKLIENGFDSMPSLELFLPTRKYSS